MHIFVRYLFGKGILVVISRKGWPRKERVLKDEVEGPRLHFSAIFFIPFLLNYVLYIRRKIDVRRSH